MKERKTWQKRIVSLLMALAMVVTQIGVWNAGKESVQAAEEILKNEERKRIHERFNCVFGRDCSRGDRDDRSCNLPGETGVRR